MVVPHFPQISDPLVIPVMKVSTEYSSTELSSPDVRIYFFTSICRLYFCITSSKTYETSEIYIYKISKKSFGHDNLIYPSCFLSGAKSRFSICGTFSTFLIIGLTRTRSNRIATRKALLHQEVVNASLFYSGFD